MRTPEGVDTLLADMVRGQQDKVHQLARRLEPTATDEDLRNPQDFVSLRDNPHFNYEDGYLAGLAAALMAVRSS